MKTKIEKLMKKVLLLLLFLYGNVLFAQELTLKDLKLEGYYNVEEAGSNQIKKTVQAVETFSNESIKSDFSNLDDLSFLKSIAKTNKVVMVGETHYARNIQNLRSRIFFGLNKFDYYPMLIVESAYSITAFSNHYVHLLDDAEAKLFLEKELHKFLYTEDDLMLLDQLREWNKINKDKPLSIGGSDLEFSYDNVLEKVVKPYFYKLMSIDKKKIDTVIALGVEQKNEFFSEVEPLMEMARKQKLVGEYPFITHSYISNVIRNFSSTNNAFRYSFDYYRQKSILRNLTDDSFYGKVLREQKVMLHGGGDHMRSRFTFPDGANFFSEGSFLNHDFPATKGKVYSIMLDCMAYTYGAMKDRDLKECVPQGGQYNSMIKTFKRGHEAGIVIETHPYFMFVKRNEFLKFASEFYYRNQSFSLNDKQWESLLNTKSGLDEQTLLFLKSKEKNLNIYDKYIVVPASEIVVARKKE